MIPIERLLYKIDFKLNKVSSGNHQNFEVWDKILALNEAQIRLVKKKVNTNNFYQLGFDANRSRYQDLQNLIIQYENLPVLSVVEPYPAIKCDLNQTQQKYFLPVAIECLANRGSCTDRQVNVPRLTKHSDLPVMMANNDFNPSFEFQETLGLISNDQLIIYQGDFQITKVNFSYLRYPQEMDIQGYEHLDGSQSQTVNCELPEHLEDELLELTILELGIDTGNREAAQGAITKNDYTQ